MLNIIKIKDIIILIVIVLIIGSGIFLCCSTFKPIWKDDLPDEYNMMLNIAKIYYKSEDKSGMAPWLDLFMKKLHRYECQCEVFGVDKDGKPNPVLYDDPKLYRNYTQCLQELK